MKHTWYKHTSVTKDGTGAWHKSNVYFAYVHSIMSYGIIFWGNQPHSEKIFKIQKRVIRIITNSRARDSCRELFKKLEILPLYSKYIFSLSIFVIKNKHLFSTNYTVQHTKCYGNETRYTLLIWGCWIRKWHRNFQLSYSFWVTVMARNFTFCN